jgi:hypothetical protein
MNIILADLQFNLGRFITLNSCQLNISNKYLNMISLSGLETPQPEVARNISSDLLDQIFPFVGRHFDILLRLLIYTVH